METIQERESGRTVAGSIALQRVQHVSVGRPRGDAHAAAARRFYGDILGLEEVAPPASLANMDLVWFRLGDNELHIFPSDEGPAHHAQHLCLQADDVEALRAHMARSGVEIVEDVAIPNRPRFFARDPFDNLIEFTTILGPYPTA